MGYFREKVCKLSAILLLGVYCLHGSSCAGTKGSPSGGPKDTLAPVVLALKPDSNAVDFPLEGGEIQIVFDEYVVIKDANKNILLSPPQKKNVKTRIRNKSLIVSFQEPLDSNRTYSLNFGNAIVDNNEGNPLYGYSYSFSTGKTIDSMMLSGTVVDATTLFPVEGATVALYENAKDSTVMQQLPDAVSRTDKWGYFTVRNLKPVPYRVFAFSDDNTNNLYDRGSETIAFIDSSITPTKVMRKDLAELAYTDPLDTLAALSRPAEIQLALFREKATNQFIRDHKRPTRRGSYIKFNASYTQIDSFAIKGISPDRIIRQFNITQDSLAFWIKDGNKLDDTLLVAIKYHKTDTNGVLVPTVENLKFVAPIERKDDKREKKDDKRKDLLEFEIVSDKTKVEQDGIVLNFKEPLAELNRDSISFTMKTPKGISSNVQYTLDQDSTDINRYIVRPVEQFVTGNDYTVYFPFATFKDINGYTNDSTVTSISLPTEDKLSSITLDIQNVENRYIIELISKTRDKVFRKYIITSDSELVFPYLQRGEYSIRITEDKNSNGLFDTGDILLSKQPEKVFLYKLPDGKEFILLNEKTDILQTIDLRSYVGDKQIENESN